MIKTTSLINFGKKKVHKIYINNENIYAYLLITLGCRKKIDKFVYLVKSLFYCDDQ